MTMASLGRSTKIEDNIPSTPILELKGRRCDHGCAWAHALQTVDNNLLPSAQALLDDDARASAFATGLHPPDSGFSVIDDEDGSLTDYLESLRRLQGLGRRAVLPGHGPELDDLQAVSAMYLAHREERLDQVRSALRALGEDATARQVVEHVYTDVDEELWDAAEKSVRAQLDYLRA